MKILKQVIWLMALIRLLKVIKTWQRSYMTKKLQDK